MGRKSTACAFPATALSFIAICSAILCCHVDPDNVACAILVFNNGTGISTNLDITSWLGNYPLAVSSLPCCVCPLPSNTNCVSHAVHSCVQTQLYQVLSIIGYLQPYSAPQLFITFTCCQTQTATTHVCIDIIHMAGGHVPRIVQASCSIASAILSSGCQQLKLCRAVHSAVHGGGGAVQLHPHGPCRTRPWLSPQRQLHS